MKSKNGLTTFILILIFLVGLSLLLYPTVSDYWNSLHQSQAIASYAEDVAYLEEDTYTQLWEAAEAYNKSLSSRSNAYMLNDSQKIQYEELLNVAGHGIMGYIEIPTIKCSLPIYHGIDEAVLQIAIGHLEWSSLPVGGEGSHCVLSGHRGLPSAKLFTDLDQLEEGDTFILRILDEILTYEVDEIHIVDPHDTSHLQMEAGEDLCTLVTCTPYGVNSHRLLVRGHRVENAAVIRIVRVIADAMQVEPMLVAPIVAGPILLILLIMVMLPKRKEPTREEIWEVIRKLIHQENSKETKRNKR